MESQPTPEQWKEVEKQVGEAERIDRQLAITKNLENRIKLRSAKNSEAGSSSELDREIDTKLENKMAARLSTKADALGLKAKELLGDADSSERLLVDFRMKNLSEAITEYYKLNDALYEEKRWEYKTLHDIQALLRAGKSTGEFQEQLIEIRAKIRTIEEEQKKLLTSSPEAYYGLHLKELKKYKDELDGGVIVETAYVKEQAEKIMTSLSSGNATFIYGHLGTGKTELAMHVAKNYILKDRPDLDKKVQEELLLWSAKNPKATASELEYQRIQINKAHRGAIVISGSKHISLAEFYGHQVLKIGEKEEEEAKKMVENVWRLLKKWEQENPNATEDEKNRMSNTLNASYIQNKGGTISDFYLGPIYRAMEEGRPVIIDEVNAIPHEVLISLNHILTRKVGDVIPVQQNSGSMVRIREGFGIIMTGNLNTSADVDTYKDRKELDPAFLSRLDMLEHDYVPQKTEGTLEGYAGPGNELFHIILAKVMDKNGNINLPEGEIKKLWYLAMAAAETQGVFSKKIDRKYLQGGDEKHSAARILKSHVCSIRAVDKIVSTWLRNGSKYELDYYVWNNYISHASDPLERALLYQIFSEKNFFSGAGWNRNPDYGKGGKIDSFNIKAPQNISEKFEFFGPRDAVDFAFGKGPERTEWPKKMEKKNESESVVKVMQAIQEESQAIRKLAIQSFSARSNRRK